MPTKFILCQYRGLENLKYDPHSRIILCMKKQNSFVIEFKNWLIKKGQLEQNHPHCPGIHL